MPPFGGCLGISRVNKVLVSLGYIWIDGVNGDVRGVRNKVVGTTDFTGGGIDEGLIPVVSAGSLDLNNIRECHVTVGQSIVF